MPLEEQTELFAQQIKNLGRFQFLLRPAIAEGHIGSAVLPLSIRSEDIDKETGEYQFPEAQLVARLRTALAKQSGIPIARLLKEQEDRVPQALPEPVGRLIPSQPNGHRTQQRARAKPTVAARQPAVASAISEAKPSSTASGSLTSSNAVQSPPVPANRNVQRRRRIS
jgi:hypothetical protein